LLLLGDIAFLFVETLTSIG